MSTAAHTAALIVAAVTVTLTIRHLLTRGSADPVLARVIGTLANRSRNTTRRPVLDDAPADVIAAHAAACTPQYVQDGLDALTRYLTDRS